LENWKKDLTFISSYILKYYGKDSYSYVTLNLISGTESEAIDKMKKQHNVPLDAEVIILSIEKV
jgi:hypothetical protein